MLTLHAAFNLLERTLMSGTANLSNGASTLPKVLFVLGGPGAGKGTQCNNLVQVCMLLIHSSFMD